MSRAVGIDEHRDRTDGEECRRCVETCIGNGRNPRTRLHPYRTQGKFQGIRAVRDAHAGSNAAATNNMNLTALGGANPDFTTACNQALTKVNLANKLQSPILVHPTTGAATHVGGAVNNAAAFQAGLTGWWNNE